jgi:hypothetical protein
VPKTEADALYAIECALPIKPVPITPIPIGFIILLQNLRP